ncbi:hypothetical protein LVD15_23185 [Fulvivirga maritima]|uniref:hypothetical protein n=1 Tax=Fulvivirga maritima TaxID=2904247 RepID=UPI001F250D38|nr:hypothetical protein [Fulvivirga maritima]UII26174.1 hypothetical protein LVD15_23185 [Fulvivirga maritima]
MFLEKALLFILWCSTLAYLKKILHRKLLIRLNKFKSQDKIHFSKVDKFNSEAFWDFHLTELEVFFPWFVMTNTGGDLIAKKYKALINTIIGLLYISIILALINLEMVEPS